MLVLTPSSSMLIPTPPDKRTVKTSKSKRKIKKIKLKEEDIPFQTAEDIIDIDQNQIKILSE